MSLVHKQDDIITVVNHFTVGQVAKLEDGGDEYLALVYLRLKVFLRQDIVYIGYFGTSEVACYLVFKVNAVVYDDHCRCFKSLLLAQFLRRHHHQPRLAGTLEVPYETFLGSFALGVGVHHAFHDCLTAKVLLVTANNLYFRSIRRAGEHGVITIYVKYALRGEQRQTVVLHVGKGTVTAVFIGKPWSPFCYRTAHTSILQFASFAGKHECVRDEHLRDALLVVHDVLRTVSPSHRGFYRGFGFTHHHRYTIYNIYQVKTFATFVARSRKLPLIGYNASVLVHLVTEKTYGDIVAVRSERIRVLLKEQVAEPLIGGDSLVVVSTYTNGSTELVYHLLCLF